MILRHVLVLLTIAGGLGGVVAGTRHRVPPSAAMVFADLTGEAMAREALASPEPKPPVGPRLPDGGQPDMTPVTVSSLDQENQIDRRPVSDQTLAHSIFDDHDSVNQHPTER